MGCEKDNGRETGLLGLQEELFVENGIIFFHETTNQQVQSPSFQDPSRFDYPDHFQVLRHLIQDRLNVENQTQ